MGKCKHVITDHNTSITQYYLNGVLKFNLHEIQTTSIMEKFQNIETKFYDMIGVQLIVKHRYFFIGKEITIESSCHLNNIRTDDITQIKLFNIMGESLSVELYAIN